MSNNFSTLGNLSNISESYRNNIKKIAEDSQKDESSTLTTTPEQRRKHLFDKNTGSLELHFKTPFWIWDNIEHNFAFNETNGNCCFNHIIGLPKKNGRDMMLFPYEEEVFRALFEKEYANPFNDPKRWKHAWIKKAAGMGITTFIIRVMLWLAITYPKTFRNSQMAIVTGIRMHTARDIMDSMKSLLYDKLKISFDSNDRQLIINGCRIQAYPAKEPKALHGLTNLSFLFMDEYDFFSKSLFNDVIFAAERYFPKSNPYVVLNSTARIPDGLLERVEKQSVEECLYKRLHLLWQKGYGYIFSKQDIEIAKQSDSWAREMEGEYRGLKGNLFSTEILNYAACLSDILEVSDKQTGIVQRSITRDKGELSLNEVISNYKYLGTSFPTSIGSDPAYNSSNFAFIVTKQIGPIIYVVKEVEMQGPTHEEALIATKELMYQNYPCYNPKLYVDASGVSFIRTLKKEIFEPTDYHQLSQENLIKEMLAINGMIICPIAFNKFGDRMNFHLKRLFELGMIRYSPEITPGLHVALTTASYDYDKQKFDKKNTSKDDIYDACRLAMVNFKIGNMGVLY